MRGRDLHPPRREAYRGEAYVSPPRPLALPPLVPYSYVRPVEDHYYRTDPRPLEPRDHRVMGIESRPHELLDYQNPYSLYGDQLPYREPVNPPPSVYAPPPPTVVANLPSSYATLSAAAVPSSYPDLKLAISMSLFMEKSLDLRRKEVANWRSGDWSLKWWRWRSFLWGRMGAPVKEREKGSALRFHGIGFQWFSSHVNMLYVRMHRTCIILFYLILHLGFS